MPSPSPPSRRRRRPRRKGEPWLGKIVDLGTQPVVVAGAFILAALICVMVATMEPWSIFDGSDWKRPRSVPEMARGLALILALALSGAAAIFWQRGQGGPARPKKKLFIIGVTLAAVGGAITVGSWITAHRALPAAEIRLAVNQTQESYRVRQGGQDVRVMLPLRMSLRGISIVDEPAVEVAFHRPGQQGSAARTFVPGQTLDIEGLRFAFAGLSKGESGYRAVLTSDGEGGLEIEAVAGQTVQLTLDGARYRVVEVQVNYLDLMGPAVKLETEGGESFWVFLRDNQRDAAAHGIRLRAIDRVPAAVMTVAPVRPAWPLGVGALLLIVGAVLFFVAMPKGATSFRVTNNVAWAAPLAAVVAVVFLAVFVGLPAMQGRADFEVVLWILAAASSVLVATTLLAAGQRVEATMATVATAVWASTLAIGAAGLARGRLHGGGFGLPLTADGERATWGIDGVSAVSELAIPLVADGAWMWTLLGGIVLAAGLALVATWQGRQRLVVIAGAALGVLGLGGALSLLRANSLGKDVVHTETAELMARQFLQVQNLPAELAERGAILQDGELMIDRLVLAPEIGAFIFIAILGLLVAFSAWRGERNPGEVNDDASEIERPGRGLFAGAIVLATLGWAWGLLLSYVQIGAVGLLAPMEWLGLSVPLFALGIFILGESTSPAGLVKIARRFGPALVLAWFIAVFAVGAVALVPIGGSSPLY